MMTSERKREHREREHLQSDWIRTVSFALSISLSLSNSLSLSLASHRSRPPSEFQRVALLTSKFERTTRFSTQPHFSTRISELRRTREGGERRGERTGRRERGGYAKCDRTSHRAVISVPARNLACGIHVWFNAVLLKLSDPTNA